MGKIEMAFLQHSTNKILPLFYNVSANTGRKSPNQAEDVALVSFLMKKWADVGGGPKFKAAAKAMTIGTANEAYYNCIDELQRQLKEQNPASKVDGYVSKANVGTTYNPSSAYIICLLSYNVGKGYPDQWPRIDRLSECPPAVVALVRREVMPT